MQNKIQIFENQRIRAIWDEKQEEWYMGTNCPQIKIEPVTNCNQLKMQSFTRHCGLDPQSHEKQHRFLEDSGFRRNDVAFKTASMFFPLKKAA